MQFDLLLVGGEVASGSRVERADVGISDRKIAAVGDLSGSQAESIVTVRGLTVMPGIIDTQVHFREPGLEHKEDFESGTRSAVAGGVTTVFEMPNTLPPTTTRELLADKLVRADGRAWSNIAFFVGAALDNLGDLALLERLEGTPGIKLFMGSSTGTLLVPDDANVAKVLRNGRFRMPVHSEDAARLEERKVELSEPPTVLDHPVVRDVECATRCTERLLRLAKETGRPVHVLHLSTADEIPLIEAARHAGQDVTCEATPQHLWFAWPEDYERLGSLVQMNPPIRSSAHRDALRKAMKEDFFDVVGSDHAPHTLHEKGLPYPKSPSGMPGVQTLGPAMLTLGRDHDLLDVCKFVRLACEAPARIYGIREKGFVEVGRDADLAIFDLNADWTFDRNDVQSKCGWSPFEGSRFSAKPVHTVVGGRFVWRDGALSGAPAGRIPLFFRE